MKKLTLVILLLCTMLAPLCGDAKVVSDETDFEKWRANVRTLFPDGIKGIRIVYSVQEAIDSDDQTRAEIMEQSLSFIKERVEATRLGQDTYIVVENDTQILICLGSTRGLWSYANRNIDELFGGISVSIASSDREGDIIIMATDIARVMSLTEKPNPGEKEIQFLQFYLTEDGMQKIKALNAPESESLVLRIDGKEVMNINYARFFDERFWFRDTNHPLSAKEQDALVTSMKEALDNERIPYTFIEEAREEIEL